MNLAIRGIVKASLADIKQNKKFADSPLVHQGRLSVVPLSDEQYQILIGG